MDLLIPRYDDGTRQKNGHQFGMAGRQQRRFAQVFQQDHEFIATQARHSVARNRRRMADQGRHK